MSDLQQVDIPIQQARMLAGINLKQMVTHSASLLGHTPPDFHLRICDWLQGCNPVYDFETGALCINPAIDWISTKKVLLGFRYAAKSWIIRQLCKCIWRINPHAQIIIHSSSEPLARKMAKAIRQALDDDPLMEDLRPERSASDYEFNLRGITHELGYSLMCAGIRTSMTSLRCDFYAFDDPEPDVDPAAMYDRIMQAFVECRNILNAPSKWAKWYEDQGWPDIPPLAKLQMLVVGQPHWQGTAYIPPAGDEAADEPHPLLNALTLRIPALDRSGEWLWPEQMEDKYYDHREDRPMTVDEVRRYEFTTETWNLQMMIDVDFARKAGLVLKLSCVKEVLAYIDEPLMVVDPADSASEGCAWGLAIGGISGNQIHIAYLDGITGEAMDFDEQSWGQSIWQRIFARAREHNVRRVYLEKNLKVAKTACRRYLNYSGEQIQVEEYHATRTKLTRICGSLEQPINNGMVSMAPQVFEHKQAMWQLKQLRWDRLPTPNDIADACARLVEILNDEHGASLEAAPVDEDDMMDLSDRAFSPSEPETVSDLRRVNSDGWSRIQTTRR